MEKKNAYQIQMERFKPVKASGWIGWVKDQETQQKTSMKSTLVSLIFFPEISYKQNFAYLSYKKCLQGTICIWAN